MYYNSIFVYLSGNEHLDRAVLRKAGSMTCPQKGFIYAISSYPSSSMIVDVPLSIKHEKLSAVEQNFSDIKCSFKANISKIVDEVCKEFDFCKVKSESEIKDRPGILVKFQEGFSSDYIKFYGRLADVIVLSKPSTISFFASNRMRRLKNAIYHTGKPTAVIPNSINIKFNRLKEDNIAVVWNGSNSCARMLTKLNGMFLKSKPEKLTVIITQDESNPQKISEILKERYTRFGIKAEIIHLNTRLRYSAEQVLEICDKYNVDTLVTAAFSRGGVLKQILFGGYTKTIVEQSKIPLLMLK